MTPDPRVIQGVRKAARIAGADPAALLATALVESGARRGVIGDQGTSSGAFQFHRGGALGSHSFAWADSPAAYLNRAQEFKRLGVHGGKGAAAVQRPADPAGYAVKVDAAKGQARTLLGQAPRRRNDSIIPSSRAPVTVEQPDLVGNTLIQSLIDANAQNAGISTIQLPVATPIAPRKTPAPVKVEKQAQGTGAVDSKGAAIVEVARRYLGTAYRWGGANPKTGFDCSGLVQWAAAQSGLKVPRTTYEQWRVGKPVSPAELQPGDSVFFHPGKRGPEHMGIYIGGGKFIQAPHTGDVVKISTLAGYKGFMGARRNA